MVKCKSTKKICGGSGRPSFRRMLAGILTLCMLMTMLPGASITVGATETEGVIIEEPDIAPEESTTPPTDADSAAAAEVKKIMPRALSIEYKVNGGAAQSTDNISTAFSAMASATDASNSYVKLLAPMTTSSGVSVSGGKFTLDLSGQTWDVGSGWTIKSEGTQITVMDSQTRGEIVSTSSKTLNVESGATLTLNGGTIEASDGGRAIGAYSKDRVDGGLITINGGTVRQKSGTEDPTNL